MLADTVTDLKDEELLYYTGLLWPVVNPVSMRGSRHGIAMEYPSITHVVGLYQTQLP